MNYVITVINPESQDLLTTICSQLSLPFTTVARGEGTADASIRNLFGMDYPREKRVVAVIADEEKTRALFRAEKRYLDIDAPGHGMTAALPIRSVGGRSVLAYLSGNPAFSAAGNPGSFREAGNQKLSSGPEHTGEEQDDVRRKAEGEEASVKNTGAYELILCIANSGTTDQVMAAARKAGARGGTVIHGKGTGDRNTPRFYNVTISAEKEIIMILTASDRRNVIMETILKEAGPATPAGAVVFSLPASAVAGIDDQNPDDSDLLP